MGSLSMSTEAMSTENTTAAMPLAGIRVLDFTRVLAGPHCTRMLADLGADVIKVEPPAGDLTRASNPRSGGMSLFFLSQNCGKRNVSIDLSTPRGAELAAGLSERVDIVVENFRPGVMADFGLDYEAMSARNPGLIYGSISGYGQTGPWRHRKAYAPVIHAEMGLMHLHGRRFGEEKPFEAFSHADVYTALECLAGLLAALHQRSITGLGQHVDVAMAATMLCVNERTAGETEFDLSEEPDNEAQVIVRTSTGAQVLIAGDPSNDVVFRNYVKVMDRPDLAQDPRFARRKDRIVNRAALTGMITEWATQFDDPGQIDEIMSEFGMPAGYVRPLHDVADTEWAREWGAFVELDDRYGGTTRVPQSPWRFSDATTGVRGTASHRGEDNGDVLSEFLNLDDAAVAALTEDGVISSRLPRPSGDPVDRVAVNDGR